MNMLNTVATLSDDALLARVQQLVGHEREDTAELVAHLAELDTRKVLTAEGHSLYQYCTEVLHLSEHAAYHRIEAARVVRRFPVVLDRLADGSVNLTTVGLLAKHLTAENHREVLAEATHLSKRQVEVLVARLAPRPDVPATIRRLPAPFGVGACQNLTGAAPEPAPASVSASSFRSDAPGSAPPAPTARPAVAPLSPSRYRMQLTVGQEIHDTLRRLQDLLCREIPDGDPAAIVGRALTLLLQDTEKKKRAATSKPRRSRGTAPRSRDISAAVERAVWERDGERCAFIGRSGRRCAETRFLELHHIDPYVLGGEKTIDKISVRCRRHNVYESELFFGPYDSPVREAPVPYGARTRSGPSSRTAPPWSLTADR